MIIETIKLMECSVRFDNKARGEATTELEESVIQYGFQHENKDIQRPCHSLVMRLPVTRSSKLSLTLSLGVVLQHHITLEYQKLSNSFIRTGMRIVEGRDQGILEIHVDLTQSQPSRGERCRERFSIESSRASVSRKGQRQGRERRQIEREQERCRR